MADAPFTVVDTQAPQQAAAPASIELEVDNQTAFTLKLHEFDKAIAEAKAQAASLEAQKAAYIFQANVDALVARSKQQPQEPPKS